MLSDGTNGVNNVTDPDAADASTTRSFLEYENVESGHVFDDITSSNVSIRPVCPGVYDMEYITTDPISNQSIKTTRKVVVLYKTGDTDFSADISPIDLNSVKVAVSTGKVGITGASEDINLLYIHRVQDTDNSGDISPIDLNSIKTSVSTSSKMQLFYKELLDE